MDIELMRRLSPRVNVIPVIGKADTLTPSELKSFKDRVSRYFLRPSLDKRLILDAKIKSISVFFLIDHARYWTLFDTDL
jgi:hypothetical protein